MEPTPRVLLLNEMANPEWTSVPFEGWAHARALAAHVDGHLVTQIRNRESILRAGLREGEDFTAIDSERLAAPLYRIANRIRGGEEKGWTWVQAASSLWYYEFEARVWRRFGERIRAGEFDLVHRLTPLSPTTPSPMARRCAEAGVPFVWGPLNGGIAWPPGFGSVRRREREWLSYVRGAHRILPGHRRTRASAACTIVGSRETWRQLQGYHQRCVYIPENGVDASRFHRSVAGPVRGPLPVAFLGRLVPYKGADMLLEAAAPLIRAGRVVVDVIGDGPELPRLRALVERQGIAAGVRCDGAIDHARLQHRLVESRVLAFPSVREFGGAVVLEAMALGLVPVVVDYGGPAELVSEGTGFAIPLGSRTQIVERLRERLAALADDPGALCRLGERGRERARRLFTWEAKARQTFEVYRWVLGRRDSKPDFGMPLPDPTGAGPRATGQHLPGTTQREG